MLPPCGVKWRWLQSAEVLRQRTHVFVLREAINKHDKSDKYINRKRDNDIVVHIKRLKRLSNVYASICWGFLSHGVTLGVLFSMIQLMGNISAQL